MTCGGRAAGEDCVSSQLDLVEYVVELNEGHDSSIPSIQASETSQSPIDVPPGIAPSVVHRSVRYPVTGPLDRAEGKSPFLLDFE